MDIGARAEIGRGSRRRNGQLPPWRRRPSSRSASLLAIAISSRGGSVTQAGTADGGAAPAAPTQLETAVAWVDGLAAGFILPSDVTSRLDTQDPEMARVVRAAWSDLRSSGSQGLLHQALGWIDGMAAGLITPLGRHIEVGCAGPGDGDDRHGHVGGSRPLREPIRLAVQVEGGRERGRATRPASPLIMTRSTRGNRWTGWAWTTLASWWAMASTSLAGAPGGANQPEFQSPGTARTPFVT